MFTDVDVLINSFNNRNQSLCAVTITGHMPCVGCCLIGGNLNSRCRSNRRTVFPVSASGLFYVCFLFLPLLHPSHLKADLSHLLSLGDLSSTYQSSCPLLIFSSMFLFFCPSPSSHTPLFSFNISAALYPPLCLSLSLSRPPAHLSASLPHTPCPLSCGS